MCSKRIGPLSRRFPSFTASKSGADVTEAPPPARWSSAAPDHGRVIPDFLPALDPTHIEARHALSTQLAVLVRALDGLDRARALLPAGAPSARWRGPAQHAYGSSVRQLAAQLDGAVAEVRSAKRLTAQAIAAMAFRV